jgi:hypothetical protein
MFESLWRTWTARHSWSPRQRHRKRRPGAARKPRVEALEDRRLLSGLHTYAYNQITALTDQFRNMGAFQGPILSASGNRAVLADAPGHSHDNARYNDIYVANTDGTGLQMVDSYEQLCGCSAELAISADGAHVVSTDGVQLRFANVDGGAGQPVIAFDGGAILHPRLTADGSRILFEHSQDGYIRGTTTLVPAGLYLINPGGTGLSQIVSQDDITRVTGIPWAGEPFGLGGFGGGGGMLEISSTGAIVFATQRNLAPENTYQRMFGVQLDDPSTLHEINLPLRTAVIAVGISGDGSTVSYNILTPPSPYEVGVENFVGGKPQMLARSPRDGHPEDQRYPGYGGFATGDNRIPLSYDGSQLLLGWTGVLINTAGEPMPLQLAARGGYFSSDLPPLLYDGMTWASMDTSATHFLYGFQDARGVAQLAKMDLDPGSAPLITDATYTNRLVRGATNETIMATVRYDRSDQYVRVSNAFLSNGIDDHLGTVGGYGVDQNVMCGSVFCDPDETEVFSSALYAYPLVPLGPRTVRIKAEVLGSDGRMHATAVDFAPIEVVDASAPRSGHRDLSNRSAALVFVNRNGPTSPAPNAPALATDAQPPWQRRAHFAEEAMLLDSLLAGSRQTRGQHSDAFWSTVGHEDNAFDPSPWAVLDLATAGSVWM